jgi:hypothetical protein
MEQVVKILLEIEDVDDSDYTVTNISMPHVPDTKPLRLYHCMEFSYIADTLNMRPVIPMKFLWTLEPSLHFVDGTN